MVDFPLNVLGYTMVLYRYFESTKICMRSGMMCEETALLLDLRMVGFYALSLIVRRWRNWDLLDDTAEVAFWDGKWPGTLDYGYL